MANPVQPPMDVDAPSAGGPAPAGAGDKRARPELQLTDALADAIRNAVREEVQAATHAMASAAPAPPGDEAKERERKEAEEFAWSALAKPVDRLPGVAELKAFLAGPFADDRRLPVPVFPGEKAPLEVPEDLRDSFFLATAELVRGDVANASDIVRGMLKWGASMDHGTEAFRGRVPHAKVQAPLEEILGISDERPAKRRLTANVNSALSASTSASSAGSSSAAVARGSTATFGHWRPDYMISVDDGHGATYTPFLGEEKKLSTELAKDDLGKKFNYQEGELGTLAPYLLAYTFANSRLEYHAILPGGKLETVAGPFNVREPADRFRLARATVNLARVIRPLADALVQGHGRFMVKQHRAHNVTVAVGKDHVVKEVDMGAHRAAMANRKPARSSWYGDHLYEFYAALQKAAAHPSIPTFGVGHRRGDSILRLCIKPVLQELPRKQSVRECIRVVADVAQALHHVHQLGWCHRDVRRPNIMREGAEGRFVLIDYEMANKVGEPVPWEPTDPLIGSDWKESWQFHHDFLMLHNTVFGMMAPPADETEVDLLSELHKVAFKLYQPEADIPAALAQLEALRVKART